MLELLTNFHVKAGLFIWERNIENYFTDEIQ